MVQQPQYSGISLTVQGQKVRDIIIAMDGGAENTFLAYFIGRLAFRNFHKFERSKPLYGHLKRIKADQNNKQVS